MLVSWRVYFQPDPWGNDLFWRSYFSNGLLQPPTSKMVFHPPKIDIAPKNDGWLVWNLEDDFSLPGGPHSQVPAVNLPECISFCWKILHSIKLTLPTRVKWKVIDSKKCQLVEDMLVSWRVPLHLPKENYIYPGRPFYKQQCMNVSRMLMDFVWISVLVLLGFGIVFGLSSFRGRWQIHWPQLLLGGWMEIADEVCLFFWIAHYVVRHYLDILFSWQFARWNWQSWRNKP